MKSSFLRINLFLLLLVFPLFLSAQTLDERLKEIDAYAQKSGADWNVPGFAIAIVKDDKVVFAKGYGVKRLDSSPSATYTRLYKAVKEKNTEAIKHEMSAQTHTFAQKIAERQNKPTDEIYVNGFTATTFSAVLPEIRDERVKDNFGAVEIYNEQEKRWEDLPFIFENGNWKLAIGEIFNYAYQSPQKPKSLVEAEKKSARKNVKIENEKFTFYTPAPKGTVLPTQPAESNAVDENTLFAIASNSKAFTTAALAILIDEKKLAWDDKVSKYLPEFQMSDPYVTRELTVRDLVTHRSGLDTFSGDLLWYETNYTTDEILRRVRFLKQKTSFRSRFGYQNLMFMAAGKIVEKVSGKTWGDFVTERILKPLEMSRTTVSIKGLKDNYAMPHNESGGKLRVLHNGNVDSAYAAAGLNSSVADVAKWLRLQLGRGKIDGKTIFSEQQSWEMWQPFIMIPVSAGAIKNNPTRHFSGYGMGWAVGDYQGRKTVSHGGGLDGMISQTAMMPEENLGLVVVTNSETPLNSIMMNKIFDVFTNAPKRDWSAEALERAKNGKIEQAKEDKKIDDSRIANTKTSLATANYAGTYSSEMYGDVTVTEENGKLVLRFLPAPNFVADLEHWHYDTFQIKWRPSAAYNFPRGFVTFTIDKTGKTDQIKVDQPNNDFWFYELELKRTK